MDLVKYFYISRLKIVKIFVIFVCSACLCTCILYLFKKKKNTIKKCDCVVTIDSGMANQFFQYTFGYILEKEFGKKVCYDRSNFKLKRNTGNNHTIYQLDNYNTRKLRFIESKKELKYYKKKYKYIVDLDNKYSFENSKKILNPDAGYGYYPHAPLYFSEKYFQKYKADIKKQLKLKIPLDEKNKKMLDEIKKHKNSISIHIRRGDFTKIYWYQSVTIENFYNKAIKIFEHMPDVHYFVFSDDIDYAKQNLKTGKPTTYVDINDVQHGYFDFELMRNCKHHINANSTFSTWAAYLSEDPEGIVVVPLHTFLFDVNNKVSVSYDAQDQKMLLSNWIRIDNFAK